MIYIFDTISSQIIKKQLVSESIIFTLSLRESFLIKKNLNGK